MKILWITNAAIEPLGTCLTGHKVNGAWVDALLVDFEKHGEYQLIIATTAPVKERVRLVNDHGTVFYALPDSFPIEYSENRPGNIQQWRQLIQEEAPDIIQVWGTEFTHGLCALRQAEGIPAVIYMQGLLEAIARYYYAGIPESELRRNLTFRDIVKRDSIIRQRAKYQHRAAHEAEMLRRAGNFISENNWCDSHIRAIVPQAVSHHCPLSIGGAFADYKWDPAQVERHSIVCTASGYPLKGLHIMLRALALLKNRYPDVKLYVPGVKVVSDGSLKWLVRKRGYTKYVERLIKQLDLADNIVWLGYLSQSDLAQRLARAHVFALTSALENHSSSLKEAMMVGVPSVASDVGGIPEYIDHGHNGLLYRFEEYELLAEHISAIFESDDLAQKLSEAGRQNMTSLHASNDIYATICGIYEKILAAK